MKLEWHQRSLDCAPLSDKASFHHVHSSNPRTPHPIITSQLITKQPRPLITIHPSGEGELGQSCWDLGRRAETINLTGKKKKKGKCFNCEQVLGLGEVTSHGDVWAAGMSRAPGRFGLHREGGMRHGEPKPRRCWPKVRPEGRAARERESKPAEKEGQSVKKKKEEEGKKTHSDSHTHTKEALCQC